MTNYIEEMMKTAGVEPTYKEPICCQDRRQVYGLNCLGCMKYDEDNGRCLANLIYSDFTAEKQLEIIKLIGNQNQQIIIAQCLVDKKTGFRVSKDSINGGLTVCNKDFTQALAQLTTKLMNAGKLDKNSVKSILED